MGSHFLSQLSTIVASERGGDPLPGNGQRFRVDVSCNMPRYRLFVEGQGSQGRFRLAADSAEVELLLWGVAIDGVPVRSPVDLGQEGITLTVAARAIDVVVSVASPGTRSGRYIGNGFARFVSE